jgi:23S rRNA (adenine-N6)-dimethyltransferase
MNKNKIIYTQNFITSERNVKEILALTNINNQDLLFEIGSGKGHFTKELARISDFVTAIELDRSLYKTTQKQIKPFKNVNVIHSDILKFHYPKNKTYKIFGNIPYNISTKIVRQIAFKSQATFSYLIVEEGFAKRVLDTTRALGLLLREDLDIKIIGSIPKTYFRPQPNVDSVLIEMKRKQNDKTKEEKKLYEEFVYKWVNQEYRKIFTKNQLRRAKQHANVTDLNQVSPVQLDSIFESYLLFRNT